MKTFKITYSDNIDAETKDDAYEKFIESLIRMHNDNVLRDLVTIK